MANIIELNCSSAQHSVYGIIIENIFSLAFYLLTKRTITYNAITRLEIIHSSLLTFLPPHEIQTINSYFELKNFTQLKFSSLRKNFTDKRISTVSLAKSLHRLLTFFICKLPISVNSLILTRRCVIFSSITLQSTHEFT